MGLSRPAFWSLTVREFWIKHRAFVRAEDRARALMFELALQLRHYKDEGANVRRNINALRRYPIKQWLVDTKS